MHLNRLFLRVISIGALALFGTFVTASAFAQDGKSILQSRCSTCHKQTNDGGINRITDVRKTPEGWAMTIFRMSQVHGLEITNQERVKLIKYLSDTQGLAPSETAGSRYILEKQPIATDTAPTTELQEMCARCHSYARVGLQRRTKDDWLKLSHFHLGQFPTAEYQAMGRDRDWWIIASTKIVDDLAKRLPLKSNSWDAWKSAKHANLSGSWQLASYQRGVGGFTGTLNLKSKGNDRYALEISSQTADGKTLSATGNAIVYTGYELRASLTDGNGKKLKIVAAVSEDGSSVKGRWYEFENDVIGGSVDAIRSTAKPKIIAVYPGFVKAGGKSQLVITGAGLSNKVNFGAGISAKVVSHTASKVVVNLTAAKSLSLGPRGISVGAAKLDAGLVVYNKIDAVQVSPAVTVARVGDAGGQRRKQPAQFEAVAFMKGADGKPGTKDDVRIGVMPAEWSVDNFDETAKALKDKDFAGSISANGLFTPAGAGLNTKRPKNTNNVGNLAISAKVNDGGSVVEGKGQLYVTVQRFVDPPIR